MNISLSTGANSFIVSENRLGRIISQEKEQATHLGLWDKIKDFFRSEKKQDVLNELYNLTHQNDSSKSQTLEKRIAVFNKIKEMADPASQSLFRIEHFVKQDIIKFCAGTTVMHQQTRETTSIEDQQFFARYWMAQINATEDLKQDFVTEMQKFLSSPPALSYNADQIAKIFQNKGYYSFNYTTAKITCGGLEENQENLTKIIQNLAPLQQAGMSMMGMHSGSLGLTKTVFSRASPFVFLTIPHQPHKNVEYSIDEESRELKIYFIITQNTNNLKSSDLGSEPLNHIHVNGYKDLRLEARFTIATNGSVACTDFNLSSKEMDDSKLSNTHKPGQDAGIERSVRLSAKPDQGELLTWLRKFIVSTDAAWVDSIKKLNTDDNKAEEIINASAQRDFSRQKLNDDLSVYSKKEKQQILRYLEGDFGQRLRTVMSFSASQIAMKVEDTKIISMANRYPGALDDLIIVLRNQLNKKERPVHDPDNISSIDKIKTSEMLALSQVNITHELLA